MPHQHGKGIPMEQEQRKQINLNFSEKYIMGKEERISRNGKQYEILWIMIPDGNDIDISSKQVFSVPSWLVGTDRELKDRRFIKLDQGRQIAVYPANGLNENFSVDKEHCHLADPEAYTGPLFNLLTGGVILGACFMATDYVTSPMSTAGGIVFGFGIGFIVMMIRYFGSYPEGMSFAILIMNMAVPLIDRAFHQRKFGRK